MRIQFLCINYLVMLIGLLTTEISYALRDVRVKIPSAVRRGEKVILKCFYDIEDDNLYAVKWYKGRREFYRYTPKENPAMKVFQFSGIKIERSASNESQLVLDAVTMATSGKYSCEVSADAPSFHTLIAAGELEVVEIPHNAPLITGIRPRYRYGDILRGNCTSRHSKPAANLTWILNNEEVNPSYVRHFKILRDARNSLETVVIGLQFVVAEQHFEIGKMKLRCTSQLHDVYWKSTEKIINHLDLHHKYSANDDLNTIKTNEPYDQYALHDNELRHGKDSYLTQLQDFLFQFMTSGKQKTEDDEYDDPAWSTNRGGKLALPYFMIAVLILFSTAWNQYITSEKIPNGNTNLKYDFEQSQECPQNCCLLSVASSFCKRTCSHAVDKQQFQTKTSVGENEQHH